jgi:hypothetical protein
MVRITRTSRTPTVPLWLLLNVGPGGYLVADAATEAGPVFSETLPDDVAAALQADPSIAEHFSFEPLNEGAARSEPAPDTQALEAPEQDERPKRKRASKTKTSAK